MGEVKENDGDVVVDANRSRFIGGQRDTWRRRDLRSLGLKG